MWCMWSKLAKCLLPVCVAALLCACSQKTTGEVLLLDVQQQAQESVGYKTLELTLGEMDIQGQGAIAIEYLDQLELTWDGETAVLKELYVTKKNTVVEAGEVLAVFDVEISQAKLAELKMKLERQQENYYEGKQRRKEAIEDAKADQEGLTSHRLTIAKQEVEKLQADYDRYVYNTKKTIEELKAQIEELEQAMVHTTIVAPCRGKVTYVSGNKTGDTISSGKVMFKMYGYEEYILTSTADDLRYNMEVTLRPDKNKVYTGRVVSAENLLPEELRSNKAVIRLDETSDVTGEQLEVLQKSSASNLRYVKSQLRDVLLVEGKSLKIDSGGNYVYVLEGSIPVKRYVTLAPGNTSARWVINGLIPGQTLVQD